jgi:hypothetical protein
MSPKRATWLDDEINSHDRNAHGDRDASIGVGADIVDHLRPALDAGVINKLNDVDFSKKAGPSRVGRHLREAPRHRPSLHLPAHPAM